jgi:hypothetical protein
VEHWEAEGVAEGLREVVGERVEVTVVVEEEEEVMVAVKLGEAVELMEAVEQGVLDTEEERHSV